MGKTSIVKHCFSQKHKLEITMHHKKVLIDVTELYLCSHIPCVIKKARYSDFFFSIVIIIDFLI